MTKTFQVFHVIFEGNSEEAYLSELNRHLRDEGINIYFNLYNLKGIAEYKKIKRKHKEAKKNMRKGDEIVIWLDNDVFKRGKLSKEALRKILGDFDIVKYNHENFEDFLIMHLSDKEVERWHEICIKEDHFKRPMNRKKVATLMREIFPDYSKGSLPDGFQINKVTLDRLISNSQCSILKFESDIVSVIAELYEQFGET